MPLDQAIDLQTLLSGYVELSHPATPRDLKVLQDAPGGKQYNETLSRLASAFDQEVSAKRLSLLDILEDHPEIKLPFETFVSLLPTIRARQYSVSSSPLWNPQKVTLTISVVNGPALSGRAEQFQGVATTFLSGLSPGEMVQLAVRPSALTFHPPSDPKKPMVLFCSGSGIAPMRAFIQERAIQKAAGQAVGKTLLFFGCRLPSEDFLYSDTDLKKWIDAGVVDVRPAFSQAKERSCGCKYVQK